MNFKLKVVSAAVVFAFGAAHQANALTIVGNSTTTLATEQLPSVTTVTLNNIGVSATTQGVVIGNAYSIKFKLLGGATFTAAGTLTQIDQANNIPYGSEAYTTSINAAGDEVTFTIVGVAGVTTSPANTIWQLTGAIINPGSSLITSGVNDNGCGFTTGSISIEARYFNSNNQEVDFPVGTGNQGVVILAAQGITGVINPTADSVLDVLTTVRPSAAPAASKFLQTRANNDKVNVLSAPIGTFSFSNVTGIQGQSGAPSTDYTLADATDNGARIGISASNGFGIGSSFYVIDDTANTACVADPTALPAITAGVPVVPTITTPTGQPNQRLLTFAPGTINTLANRTKTYTICYTVSGTDGNVPTSQFSGYVEQDRTGTDVSDFTAGSIAGSICRAPLARATINGGIIAVRNFVPASVNAFGWAQQLRIINAGSVATPITAYFQYADGTTSPESTIVAAPIAAGGSATITNAQIESAMGTAVAANVASNPRLIITGATERLRVQNYIVQPGGNWVEASGGQDDGEGPAGTNN